MSEFAFYYLYDSNLPVHPESPGKGPEFYGPSGNDVPFRMASVNIDALLERYPAGAADWESRKVISAVTCGLGMDNNAEWWSGVVQCWTPKAGSISPPTPSASSFRATSSRAICWALTRTTSTAS